jgi:hypothetical protein
MALSNKPRGLWWSRLHFLIRFLGLTSVLVAGVGLAIAWRKGALANWEQLTAWEQVRPAAEKTLDDLVDALRGMVSQNRQIFAVVMASCAGLVVFALLVEFLAILARVSGRRSAFGFNAVVQIGLAVVLLIGVNVYSFTHGRRLDWTSDRQFTLPPEIREQLGQLQGETTIIVYQQHKTFGPLTDKPDAYDYAAERKVVEKVKDLVEEFREFGPQFTVEVLNVEDDGFKDQLARLTDKYPQLRDAVATAPENSIFIVAGDKVQTLSFNEFYQLDKKDSEERKNLVLLKQGVKPFADKVLNVEAKRPVVGVAVIHGLLATDSERSELTLAGLRKSLTAHGFEVRDIILKRWGVGLPEPGVFTNDDSKLDRVEDDITDLEADIAEEQDNLKRYEVVRKFWKETSLEELNKKVERVDGKPVDAQFRDEQVAAVERRLDSVRDTLAEKQDSLKAAREQKAAIDQDAVAESRRMSDVKAKLDRALADCDMLIVPRLTQYKLKTGFSIESRLYRLNDAQVAAMRDFLKRGKPILACFGPTNEPEPEDPGLAQLGPAGADGLEDLLIQLGFRFGKETVLFGVESKHSRRASSTDPLSAGATAEVPPVSFEGETGAGRPLKLQLGFKRPPNPVRESMRVTSQSVGKELNLRLQHPRPIYYEPSRARMVGPVVGLFGIVPTNASPALLPYAFLPLSAYERKPASFEPEFMVTNRDGWNAEKPFPIRGRLPRFQKPKEGDKTIGTLDEPRHESFPVGVAFESTVPLEWYADGGGSPTSVRVAAIGQGHWFTGRELSPDTERLLLNTCTWLLGRDEYLPHRDEDQIWSYPRVSLNQRDKALWTLGAVVALPAVFFYLGVVVLLVRWLR